ncbi:hypothetical protein [Puia sp.]|jgi:hypothetical protein|uniref:hypothetical protein n=1 Tax=Puia sp. TaxID=2045100 RepID=UPI002F41FF76
MKRNFILPAFLLGLFGMAWIVVVAIRLSHGPYGFYAWLRGAFSKHPPALTNPRN